MIFTSYFQVSDVSILLVVILFGWANLLPLVSRVGCSQISTVLIVLLSHWVGFEENPSKTNGKPNLTATSGYHSFPIEMYIAPPRMPGCLYPHLIYRHNFFWSWTQQRWLPLPSIIVNHIKILLVKLYHILWNCYFCHIQNCRQISISISPSVHPSPYPHDILISFNQVTILAGEIPLNHHSSVGELHLSICRFVSMMSQFCWLSTLKSPFLFWLNQCSESISTH